MKKKSLFVLFSALLFITIALTYAITASAVRHDNARLSNAQEVYTSEYTVVNRHDEADEVYGAAQEINLLYELSQGHLAKVFFGEWVVEELISICRRLGATHSEIEVRAQELVGTKIYMSYYDILINGEALGEAPWYYIIVRPMNPTPHPQFLPGPAEVIKTPFSVYVNVELLGIRNTSGTINDEFQFYIIDENTLYLIYNSAFFRLKRWQN